MKYLLLISVLLVIALVVLEFNRHNAVLEYRARVRERIDYLNVLDLEARKDWRIDKRIIDYLEVSRERMENELFTPLDSYYVGKDFNVKIEK